MHFTPGGGASCGTSSTSFAFSPARKGRVPSMSKRGSIASMQQEKAVWLASAKRGTLNTGWCGRGRPFRNSIPNRADNDATRISTSKAIGMKTGQLLQRPAADVERIIDRHRPVLHEEAGRRRPRARPPARRTESALRGMPSSLASPSTG